MKLYTNPNRAQAQPFYADDVLPASAYRLQQQTLAAYREMCTWYQPYTLLELVYLPGSGGRSLCDPKTGTPLRAATTKLDYEDWVRKQVRQAREKLRELVPEVILMLTVDELQQAADVLLQRGLVPFIWHIFGIERGVQYRIEEGNSDTRLSDDSHAKAAGLGRTYSKKDSKRLPKLVLQPVVPDVGQAEEPLLPPIAIEQTAVEIAPSVETPALPTPWPHNHCAVCPGLKLRQKTPHKASARKRLQFEYRR